MTTQKYTVLICAVLLTITQASLSAAPRRKPPAPTVPPMIVSASTHALFQFRCDDAPSKLTTISLNAAQIAAQPVSPNVFGNFIENLGTAIYDNLWADVLHHPSLEKIEDRDGEAPWWDQTGSAAWVDSDGYRSPRCVKLSGQDGTLSQRVFLPVYRHKHTLHGVLPANAIPKGQPARFVISHVSGGAVDVDQISLLPDDAIHNFDPDALKAAQTRNIPLLRFSGNYSSGYHWHDGVGQRDALPAMRNVAGFASAKASATVLTSSDPQATNTWDRPDTVRPQPFPMQKSAGPGEA